MQKTKLLALFVLMILMNQLQAQNEPSWVSGKKPQGVSGKFSYEITSATSADVEEARKNAFSNLLRDLSAKAGETFTVESTSNIDVTNKEMNGNAKTATNFVMSSKITTKGKQITKFIQTVEFYRKGNEYWALYRITDVEKDINTPVFVYNETRKGLSFIPGAAQFNKMETGKVAMFIVGEVGFVTGIVVSQIMFTKFHNDYAAYIKKGDLKNADIVKTNRDNMGIVRSVCIIGTAGLYIYNVIDGYLSKGKPQFAQNKLKIYPNLAYNQLGLGLSLTFN